MMICRLTRMLQTKDLLCAVSLSRAAGFTSVWIIKSFGEEGIRYGLEYTRVGTLVLATIYLQMIQNRYMFRSFTVLQCSHQHCVQPVASDVEVVGYL